MVLFDKAMKTNKIRIEIDGNDGTGKSYVVDFLRSVLNPEAFEISDRGVFTKLTTIHELDSIESLSSKSMIKDKENDILKILISACQDKTIYVILDDSVENCQKRILSRGDSIEQEFHNVKDLTKYKKRYERLFDIWYQAFDNNGHVFGVNGKQFRLIMVQRGDMMFEMNNYDKGYLMSKLFNEITRLL